MITKKQIEDFFASKKFAIAGASRNEKKFGHAVYEHFKEQGFDTFPVNPEAELIGIDKCYRTIAELPAEVDRLVVVTPKSITENVLKDAINKGIKHIWIQQMSETPEALKLAKENGVNVITGKCIFMFTEPVKGIHKFHRSIVKFFGGLPK